MNISGASFFGVVLSVLTGGTLLGPANARAQQPVATPPVVFDQVTVIDVTTGKRLPAQRVVIVGTRITAMGPTRKVSVPRGAKIIDAKGKYLIPGLWDLHVHPGRFIDMAYRLMVANGVTGFRDAGSQVPLDTLHLWRREILAGTRVGPPRQILSGQSIKGPEPDCQRSKERSEWQTCIADSADARHYVDSLKAAGADMIKPRAVTKEMYFVIAAEARRIGIPFGGHVNHVTAAEASDSGAVIVDHFFGPLETYGVWGSCGGKSASLAKCQTVAEQFKRNGTWLVPTRNDWGGPRDFEDRMREFWAGLPPDPKNEDDQWMIPKASWVGKLLPGNWLRDSSRAGSADAVAGKSSNTMPMQLLSRVGLPILAGTDASGGNWYSQAMGFILHRELKQYVTEGLTPLQALQSATLNPAIFLHATDSLGTVASGKLADLVLLDADPLADITNTTTIRAVVANGRYFDRAALDQLLIAVQAQVKQNSLSSSGAKNP